MEFSRNPVSGKLEAYSDEGMYSGHVITMADLMRTKNAQDGGPGSGNFGHAGRPGKVGGSSKGSGGSAFRSGTKETGYSSFKEHKLFKGIASHARAAKSKGDFIDRMNKEQREALTNQYFACGADMGKGHRYLGEYAGRIYDMLHNRSGSEIRQKNNPVEGKDLSETWEYEETKESWERTEGTKEIDTEIESIIHAQGFDGVPKVVSKEEFDRITKENPQMPILFRTYAAPTPETLDEYDKDLESGFFYVDCGTGGAGFGQGMYCAGVYQYGSGGFKSIDDISRDEALKNIGFVEIDGDVYRRTGSAKNSGGVSSLIGYELEVGDHYCFWNGDKRTGVYVAKMDDDEKVYFENEKTGEKISRNEAYSFDGAVSYKKVDVEKRKELLEKGAIEEMKHYRALNLRRLYDSDPHVAPEGKIMVTGGTYDAPVYKYYDPNSWKSFADSKPEEGQMIAYWENEAKTAGEEIMTYTDGKIKAQFGKWDAQDTDKWAVLEGDCEKVPIDPKASTRLMTLDPTAKIVTFSDLQELRTKLVDREQKRRSKAIADQKMAFVDNLAKDILDTNRISGEKRDKYERMFFLYSFGEENDDEELESLISELKERTNSGILSIFARKLNKFEPERPKVRRIPSDYGVLATMLGYDAIDAVGHGESKSYTVVLNRTKLIVSEERLDLEE